MTFLQRHAYSIGSAIATALWPFFPRRRKISVENLLKCKITSSHSEAPQIAKTARCHLAGHIAEALFVPSVVTKENWREHLDFSAFCEEGIKVLLYSPETPIILVSSHHGVWEAATNILSFARPMIAIARTMNNRFVSNWMKNHHFRGSITIIDKNRGFTPQVIREWEKNSSALTILVDQHANKGELLQFLGRPAKTVTSAARLAVRTGYPVVVGSFLRNGPYNYKLMGREPLVFSRQDDVLKVAQILNDRLGECIRECPEQYLWSHRRWRND